MASCCDYDGVCLKAAGYFGVWTAGAAWYIAFAELLNETWFRGRVCLPLFLPIPYQELQLWYSLALPASQLQTHLLDQQRNTSDACSVICLTPLCHASLQRSFCASWQFFCTGFQRDVRHQLTVNLGSGLLDSCFAVLYHSQVFLAA